MNHGLCIIKTFNDAIRIYKKHWLASLAVGTLIAGFWFTESKVSGALSSMHTFLRHELPYSNNSLDLVGKLTSAVQYQLTLPYINYKYVKLALLLLIFIYLNLFASRFFLNLFNTGVVSFRGSLVSFAQWGRACIVYLFIALLGIVFTLLAFMLFNVGKWFLLSNEIRIFILYVYAVCVVLPTFLSFTVCNWSIVEKNRTVSEVIDHSLTITSGNKMKIIVIEIFSYILGYSIQFLILRLFYKPLMTYDLFSYAVVATMALVVPLKKAIWTAVYQQIK